MCSQHGFKLLISADSRHNNKSLTENIIVSAQGQTLNGTQINICGCVTIYLDGGTKQKETFSFAFVIDNNRGKYLVRSKKKLANLY